MEFLLEILLDLILEGSIEVSTNKKVSKWIRYPLVCLIILFFSVVIFGLLILGFIISYKNLLCGLLIILVSVILLIAAFFKLKKLFLERR